MKNKTYHFSTHQFEKNFLKLFGRKLHILDWEIKNNVLTYTVSRTKETIWESGYKILINHLCDQLEQILLFQKDHDKVSHFRFLITKKVNDKFYSTFTNRLVNDQSKDKENKLDLILLENLNDLVMAARSKLTKYEYVNLIKKYEKEKLLEKIKQKLKI